VVGQLADSGGGQVAPCRAEALTGRTAAAGSAGPYPEVNGTYRNASPMAASGKTIPWIQLTSHKRLAAMVRREQRSSRCMGEPRAFLVRIERGFSFLPEERLYRRPSPAARTYGHRTYIHSTESENSQICRHQ
jgi:hypothetical protein